MHPDRKTLIILSPAFPADESDSTWLPSKQLFVKTLAEQFPGTKIMVLTFNYPGTIRTYDWNNVTVQSFNGMHKHRLQRRLLWLKVWNALQLIRKTEQVAGIFSFWCGECALVGHYFGKRYHIKHYTWISGQDAKKENKLVKWIRPKAGELVTISDFLSESFYMNHGIKPRYVIPLGIAPELFPPISQQRDIDIIGAGSLIPLKQYDILIYAVQHLVQYFPNIRAVICGDGAEYESLQQLISSLHLQKNISLLREVPHTTVLSLMNHSKILLHPSSYEGLGAVCMEALYAGCNVISFTRPLHIKITGWHHVDSQYEMFEKAKELLLNPPAGYTRLFSYEMKDCARSVMNLFE